jgi:hypothetical protein
MHNHEHDIHDHCCHGVIDELVCHFPYAIFSLSISFIVLTMISALAVNSVSSASYYALFHTFHYLHIVFAGVGTVITFFRFSRNFARGIVVSFLSPIVFCVLSDVIMPYLGGTAVGITMKLHICFYHEFTNIGVFLLAGILTGFALIYHGSHTQSSKFFARWAHFWHILLSSLASMFYMVASGFEMWMPHIGVAFVILVVGVVVPCTLSDVIVPVVVARSGKNK